MAALVDVESRFRRVRGFRELGCLLAALGGETRRPSFDNRKEEQ